MLKSGSDPLWSKIVESLSKGSPDLASEIEIKSVFPVVELTAKGLSVRYISKKLELSDIQVDEDLVFSTGLSGWKDNKEYSPFACWKDSDGTFESFRERVLSKGTQDTDRDIHKAFVFVSVYVSLGKRLEELENGNTRH